LKLLVEEPGMQGWVLTALGFVAGACTTFSLVPQLLKAWRAADKEAISKRTYAVATAAYALWIIHGLMIGSAPIILFNALALLLGSAILVLKLRDAAAPRKAWAPGMLALSTIIGLIAGCLSSWSLVPQLLKCWQEGLTEAVSKKMFATRAFGLVLWCIYGFFAGSLPVLIFSALNLVLSTTILVLTIRNSQSAEARTT
jgi:MtN3 and saliva related transmembrane protein